MSAAVAAGACRLGSRLYFEFMGAALGDVAAWEGLADGVAVEVRRHGAPAPTVRPSAPTAAAAPVAAQDGFSEAVAAPTVTVLAPTALAAAPPIREVAAPPGVGVSSVVNVDSHNTVNHTVTTNNNSNNTSTNNSIGLL